MESDGQATFNKKVDIWSMGCILYEITTGDCPFKNDWEVIKHSLSGKKLEVVLADTFDLRSKAKVIKLIADMLKIDPSARPSAAQLTNEFINLILQRPPAEINHQNSLQRNDKSSLSTTHNEPTQASLLPRKRKWIGEEDDVPRKLMPQRIPLPQPPNERMPVHLMLQGRSAQDDVDNLYSRAVKALYRASENGNIAEVRSALAMGVDINTRDGNLAALDIAMLYGHESLASLLLAMGADFRAGAGLESHLHTASWQGWEGVACSLLKKGVDVNARGFEARTPLHCAASYGKERIVRVLLENGADIHAEDVKGTALHAAARAEKDGMLQLLLETGAHVDAEAVGDGTALQIAVRSGNEEMVRLLVENGADVNAQSVEPGTPLQISAMTGKEALVRLLLENGAEVNSRSEYCDANLDLGQRTALEVALEYGHDRILRVLWDHGAKYSCHPS